MGGLPNQNLLALLLTHHLVSCHLSHLLKTKLYPTHGDTGEALIPMWFGERNPIPSRMTGKKTINETGSTSSSSSLNSILVLLFT